MQLLKEAIPGLTSIGVLVAAGLAADQSQSDIVNEAARALRLKVTRYTLTNAEEFEGVLRKARKAGIKGLYVGGSPLLTGSRVRLAELFIKYQLPAIGNWNFMADAGFLMGYSPRPDDLARNGAVYVDKIFRGARPADLPVEEPTRYFLVVNLKTARALKLKIPKAILARADRVIE